MYVVKFKRDFFTFDKTLEGIQIKERGVTITLH